LGKEGALRITSEQELHLIEKNRRETRLPIERLGEIELGGIPLETRQLMDAEADRSGGGLRTFSYQHEMRIFANSVRMRKEPTCTGEIGHNSIVATIVGTEAQYNNQPRSFAADMFA
jgi:hypothetical protein